MVDDRSPHTRGTFREELLRGRVVRVRGDGEPSDGEIFREGRAPDGTLESDGEASHREVADREPPDGVAAEGETSESDRTESESADGDTAEGDAARREEDSESDVADRDPTSGDSPLRHTVLDPSRGDVDERESQKLEARPVIHGLFFPGTFFHYLELEPFMKPRLALLTAGHLSTCPRMLKAADALAEVGYEVTLISTRSTTWAAEADLDVQRRRQGRWESSIVDYSRSRGRLLYAKSGLGRRLARALAARTKDVSFPLATRAFARVHRELVAAALATSADFYYGGTTGGVGAAFEAAKRAGRPYALDLEDFFSGEPKHGSLDQRLAERIEREILPDARFLTASSEPIAAAYSAEYGVSAEVIHNVFPLPGKPPDIDSRSGPLRLYWFSQTIGRGRGLEEAIAAAGLSGIEAELHLRGEIAEDYRESLRTLARAEAPNLALTLHPPGAPDEMTPLASPFDIGLSLEQPVSLNRRLCLTNKALVYPLAGLALVMTDTPGHQPLRDALRDKALVVPQGDGSALAEGFRRFARDRRHLLDCRRASWEAAMTRWHWEHPEERGKLLRLFEAATR